MRKGHGSDFASIRRRFLAKVEIGDDCWNWTACLESDGYGRFKIRGKTIYAHRVSYELFIGPIPKGLTVDHRCRNRACQNPAHLRLLTRGANVLAGVGFSALNKAKTTCPKGHAFDVLRQNRRGCNTCNLERQRDRYAKNKLTLNQQRREKYNERAK